MGEGQFIGPTGVIHQASTQNQDFEAGPRDDSRESHPGGEMVGGGINVNGIGPVIRVTTGPTKTSAPSPNREG